MISSSYVSSIGKLSRTFLYYSQLQVSRMSAIKRWRELFGRKSRSLVHSHTREQECSTNCRGWLLHFPVLVADDRCTCENSGYCRLERSNHVLHRTSTTRFVVSTPVLNGECTNKRTSDFNYRVAHINTLHCRSMLLNSELGVFKLPNEVLVQVFRNFVDDMYHHSPVVLTYVCRLWRQLVHATGSLWTFIDLEFIQRSKHHLAFAKQQRLVVQWQCISFFPKRFSTLPDLDNYEWILSQASHFTHLDLWHDGRDIDKIFDRLRRHELSNLESMTIRANLLPCVPRSTFAVGCMPKLRHISLS